MAISVKSDFVGDVDLAQANIDSNLTPVIAWEERDILTKLMGAKLYNEAVIDGMTNGSPGTQKFIDLLNGVTYTNTGGFEVNYLGLKKMLLYFIWAEYVKTFMANHRETGLIINNEDNARRPSSIFVEQETRKKRDKGVNLYNEAWAYINDTNDQGTTFFTDVSNWTYKRESFKSRLVTINVR